jgi:hypothetical protein
MSPDELKHTLDNAIRMLKTYQRPQSSPGAWKPENSMSH